MTKSPSPSAGTAGSVSKKKPGGKPTPVSGGVSTGAGAAGTTTTATTATTATAATAAAASPRDAIGGWLLGPQVDSTRGEWKYKGERLGLPESGPGSLAGQGRRIGALFVDWALAYLATGAFGWHPTSPQGQWGVIALFAAQMLVLESLLGFTIGKRIFGIHVGRLGGPLTPLQVIARTVLLLLLIPPAIWDQDGRGMHDRLAGTVVLNR